MASGQANEFMKLYLYAQPNDGGVFLMEFTLNVNTNGFQITMKSDRKDIADSFATYVLNSLGL